MPIGYFTRGPKKITYTHFSFDLILI